MEDLRERILKLLEKDSRMAPAEIATALAVDPAQVSGEIEAMEREQIICGYHTMINWDRIHDDSVTAMIELRVTPQGGDGFNKIAEQIYQYPQVEALYLMSGAYDFLVIVRGRTIKDISLFVSSKLASIEEVQSTATHFTLVKYKE